MRKYIIPTLLLFAGLNLFTACDDDRDSNPIIQQPTEFVLNTPAYADSEIDLLSSQTVNFTWSQPDYGYTAVVSYKLQVSTTGTFTHSLAEAEADETGATVADYVSEDGGVTSCNVKVEAATFAKMLMQLNQWEENAVPATQKVYVRVLASIYSATATELINPIISNVVEINVIPYYVELKDALPEMWYLIGACIGDGKWNNNSSAIGTSLYPMSIVKDYEYDKKTGEGELTFTGWFTPDGFKLIKVPGSWDEQWGSSDGGTNTVMNEGKSGNICVPEAGYYTLKLNTKNDQLTIEKADITPAVYESICITGDFNGWVDTAMIPVNTVVDNNHIWSFILDASNGDTTVKFKIAGSWDTNWGAESFPYGIGANGGSNISVNAGKYAVVFNDIDGSYTFTAIE